MNIKIDPKFAIGFMTALVVFLQAVISLLQDGIVLVPGV